MKLLQLSPAAQRRVLWIVAVIALAAYYPRYLKGEGVGVFAAAADCMLRGQTPLHCPVVIFAYPPFFALLAVPLALMPAWLGHLVWYLVLVGTLYAALRLCEALALRLFPGQWSERELAWLRVLGVALTLKFILAVLENQAYDSIAFVFILLGLMGLSGGRTLLGSASLAAAAALKVTPLIFLPYLLFKRRFAGAAVFTAVVVVLTLLPDIVLPPQTGSHALIWVREVMIAPFHQLGTTPPAFHFWVTDSPMNQSFHGAVARLISEEGEPQLYTMVLRIVEAVYIAGAALVLLDIERATTG